MNSPHASRASVRPLAAVAAVIALFTLGNALIAGCGGNKTSQSGDTTATATPAPAPAATADAGDEGAKIYAEKCTVCHGPGGKGDGPGGAALNPKPRDHTDGSYMNTRTDAQLLEVLHNGKGAMPAWKGILSDEQMQAVLKHVRSLAVPPYPGS